MERWGRIGGDSREGNAKEMYEGKDGFYVWLCIFRNWKLVRDQTLRCELEELLLGSVKVIHESWQSALRFKARLEYLPCSNCCVVQHTAWLVSGPCGCASNNHLPLETVMSWKQAPSSLGLHQSCVSGDCGLPAASLRGVAGTGKTAVEEQCPFSTLTFVPLQT